MEESSPEPKPVNERLLNSLLGSFLISKLPLGEQLIPRLWLHILHPPPIFCPTNQECEGISKKDALVRSFLLNLLDPPLKSPFKDPPSDGSLPDAPQVSMKTPDTKWAAELAAMSCPDEQQHPPSNSLTPTEFLSRQPKPINGAFCYAAVFSDITPTVTFRNK